MNSCASVLLQALEDRASIRWLAMAASADQAPKCASKYPQVLHLGLHLRQLDRRLPLDIATVGDGANTEIQQFPDLA